MAVTAETERVADVRRYRFTVDEFARMGEAGIFTAEDRVELLDGEIVAMTPIGALHAGLVSRLNELIVTCLAGNAYVGIQNPVRLDHHTEPQPDLVVARRRTSFYTDRHPEPGDIFLVIEVADSSLRYDRLEKVPRYGRGRHSRDVAGGRGGRRRHRVYRSRRVWLREPASAASR